MPQNEKILCPWTKDPKVVATVLQFLPIRTLKDVRLVSKLWNKEACFILQRKELVEFHHVVDISKFLATFSRNHDPEFPCPFAKFYFCKIRLNLIHDNYLLRTFFKNFSTTTTHIQLDLTGPQFRLKYLRLCVFEHIGNVSSVTFTFKDFYEVWPASLADDYAPLALHGVKELVIYGFGRECSLKSVLTKVLPFFPNVERIEAGEQIGRLIFELCYEKEGLDKDPDSADGLTYPKPFPRLGYINFNYIHPAQIDRILKDGLKLKGVKGGLHLCSEVEVKRLLEGLATSLEDLALETHNTSALNFPFPMMAMTALVKLELTKFRLNLAYLTRNFPMLRILKLKKVKILCPSEQELGPRFANRTVELLSIEICDLSKETVKGLGRLLPGIRMIQFPFQLFEANDKLMVLIIEEMRSLEEIQLHVGQGEGNGQSLVSELFGGKLRLLDKADHCSSFVKIVDFDTKEVLKLVEKKTV